MSKRWKPKEGEQYWIIAFGEVVKATWYADSADLCRWQVGNCFKTKEEAVDVLKKFTDLLLSLHEPTKDCNQLPKLTAEVFDRPDCPGWAQWAAVDVQGLAYWYQYSPVADERIGVWKVWGTERRLIGFFDRSDWRNSLIERPAKETKLPDWCKVGEWVYDKAINKYSQVAAEDITEHLQEVCKSISKGEIVQARPRPYNADEMQELVGRVIATQAGYILVDAYRKSDSNIHTIGGWFTADHLMQYDYTVDGKPCYVLEHVNDKG